MYVTNKSATPANPMVNNALKGDINPSQFKRTLPRFVKIVTNFE